MSQTERDRLHWLKLVKARKLTQIEAARRMNVSARWVRQLLERMKTKGDRVVIHQLRGKPSNRRLSLRLRAKAVKIVSAEYRDFGPTLASEYLAEKHGLTVSKETLRQWLIASEVWKPKRAKSSEVHVWRRRRDCFGELGQWDTSERDWLEGRGDKIYLIAMIDDATSRIWANFARHDSTEENMRLLWSYLERFGRPLEFYTDRANLFVPNRPVHFNKREDLEPTLSQIGRALQQLAIGWIPAHSPQAKGRVERSFGTAQHRLVKGLRVAGARSLEDANRYLHEVYLPMWNQRFTHAPSSSVDAHRPLLKSHELASILSRHSSRQITNGYTLRLDNCTYQMDRADARPSLRQTPVLIEQRLDSTLAFRGKDGYLRFTACSDQPAPIPADPRPPRIERTQSRWMTFDLKDSLPLWKTLKRSSR